MINPPPDRGLFNAADFFRANELLRWIEQNLANECAAQNRGIDWDRETMQKHVNDRAALLRANQILLDKGLEIFGELKL